MTTDPWELGNYWPPQSKEFKKIKDQDGLNTYHNEWAPGESYDPTWIGKKNLALAVFDLLREIKIELDLSHLSHSVVRICGGAARNYVHDIKNLPKDIDVFICSLKDAEELKAAQKAVIRAISRLRYSCAIEKTAIEDITAWVSHTISDDDPFSVRFGLVPYESQTIEVEVLSFCNSLKEVLDDSDWGETSFALGISRLPEEGTVFVQTPSSLNEIQASNTLSFNSYGIRDASRTLERGLNNARLLNKGIRYEDAVELFAMIGLSHDDDLELICP